MENENEDQQTIEELLEGTEVKGDDEEELEIQTDEENEEGKEGDEEEVPEIDDEVKPRPSLKEVQVKYPDLFKDFPQLRDMYFREDKLTKIFPTVEDASQAKTDLDAFQTLELGLKSGKQEDVEFTLNSIKELSEEALPNFALNILPALEKVNEDAYLKAITPVLISTLRDMYDSGVKFSNDNLKNTALSAAMFLFKDPKIASGETKPNLAQPKIADSNENKERNSFLNERHDMLLSDVTSDYESNLKSEILSELDKDGVMTDFMKNALVEQIIKRVNGQLKADTAHQSKMSKLWNSAEASKYSRDWKDRILNAALSRAKSIMPSVRAKARSEALGTRMRSDKKVLETNDNSRGRVPNNGGSTKSGKVNLGNLDSKKIDWSKTSDMDILDGKVTLKS